jgi:hypothetical protein
MKMLKEELRVYSSADFGKTKAFRYLDSDPLTISAEITGQLMQVTEIISVSLLQMILWKKYINCSMN